MSPSARYITKRQDGILCVVDCDFPGTKSVTNDIEAVVAELASRELLKPDEAFLYCDSDRIWDGVETKAGKFARFIPLNQPNLCAAIDAILRCGSL